MNPHQMKMKINKVHIKSIHQEYTSRMYNNSFNVTKREIQIDPEKSKVKQCK
jgi:hypothetical protein